MNYVIWSEEHGAWWAPARNGYTRELAKAGSYTEAEAEQIVANANRYQDLVLEFMIPDIRSKLRRQRPPLNIE